ncbi:ABC transporter substrate-binding protein [uncultured Gammaproteobacteria bacterium]
MAREAERVARGLCRGGWGGWGGVGQKLLAVSGAALVLAGCSLFGTVTAPPPSTQAPVQVQAPPPRAAPVKPVVMEPVGGPGMPGMMSGGAVKVALLLPLTGTSAALGQGMADAAQLALFDAGTESVALLPRDTGGTPAGAVEAARQALADGAGLIVGPLFSSEVGAVKALTIAAGRPMLAFSNDGSLAGGGTFILGFTPGEQVARVIGFARSRGLGRFAVLAPRSAYGEAVVSALVQTTTRLGGIVVRQERYDPALADPTLPVRGLVAAGGFDAVLIAEGGDRLRQFGRTLLSAGIDPQRVRLLGTGLWDEAGLGREPTLVGGWYATALPAARADFEARFAALYGHPAPRLATLAYDATALAAQIARGGAIDAAGLTNPNGFSGVDGVFRLRPDGLAERALAVLEVTSATPQVVDPPPAGFQALAW